jgi:hypothetical protein
MVEAHRRDGPRVCRHPFPICMTWGYPLGSTPSHTARGAEKGRLTQFADDAYDVEALALLVVSVIHFSTV